MASRVKAATVVSDQVKVLLRRQVRDMGWTAEHVAFEMQRAGHEGWNFGTVHMLMREDSRAFTVDEALGIIAVFSSENRLLAKELERVTTLLTKREKAQ